MSDEAIDWVEDEYQSKLNIKVQIFSFDENDYVCPVYFDSKINNSMVNKKYCESFSHGTGCRNLKTCKAYNR